MKHRFIHCNRCRTTTVHKYKVVDANGVETWRCCLSCGKETSFNDEVKTSGKIYPAGKTLEIPMEKPYASCTEEVRYRATMYKIAMQSDDAIDVYHPRLGVNYD